MGRLRRIGLGIAILLALLIAWEPTRVAIQTAVLLPNLLGSAPTPLTLFSGAPRSVAGREVDSVREEWVVEDRWWTGKPLRRRYFELVLLDGRNVVVFRDLVGGGWFLQRS